MHIGLTYDLRSEYLAAGYSEEETAEFDRDDTIAAIDAALRQLGHETDRIGNVRQLIQRVAAGDRWDLVFNFCEGLHGPAREAQAPAVLDVYGIPYTFSDPLIMALSLHKGMTKAVLQAAGVSTPRFRVIEQLADLESLDLTPPLFAKPVAEGTGKGVTPHSKVTRLDLLPDVCADLLTRFDQPVLVEEYLPGREFTVGLLGTGEDARVLGTLEIVLRPEAEPDVYSYVNKERCEDLVDYQYPSAADDAAVRAAEAIALAAWRALGCRDAGRVDLRCDALGRPQFMEVNPLAGLHPHHSDLPMIATAKGMPYVEMIEAIVRSAALRVGELRVESRELRAKSQGQGAVQLLALGS
jgi:D-alanine-D-alanine ligase